uniref:DUF38 domain-containing protein n=1 Tax=Panagrolaimus sp. JU765 TaxID=591449 RepID=A0AC34RFT7_9BILA
MISAQKRSNIATVFSQNIVKMSEIHADDIVEKVAEKENVVAKMNDQVEASKKCILKIQSKKNRLLRPVQLSSALYGEIFNMGLQFKSVLYFQELVPLFLIGKEAKNGLVEVLKSYKNLEFYNDRISFKNVPKYIFGNYSKFSTMLVEFIAPYVTKVCFIGEVHLTANYDQLFFESLSKNQNQRYLKIWYLKKIDEFFIEAVKKLNEKNIPVELKCPEKKLLLDMPGLRFDRLKILTSIKEFSVFIWNNFPCRFSKLHIQFNNLIGIMNPWEVFRQLNEAHASVQKLKISFLFCHDGEAKYGWNEIKNSIEDAPQQEIIVKFTTLSRQQYEKAIASFGGVRIDGNLSQWKSSKNEMKVIKVFYLDY